MSFKFTWLPLLVKLIVIQCLDYPDMFCLSLCSSKMLKIIRKIKYKNVASLRCSFWKKSLQIELEEHNGRRLFICAVDRDSETPLTRQGTPIKIGAFIGALAFYVAVDEEGTYYALSYEESQEEIVKLSMIRHVSDLFEQSPSVMNLGKEVELGKLPDIQGIEDTRFTGDVGDAVEASFLDDYFKKYPNQKSACIEPNITGEFEKNSKIFEVENLHFGKSSTVTASILHKFTGKDLRLCNAKCQNLDIHSFLNKWINSRGYQNLETLWIKPSEETEFTPRDILNDFQKEDWLALDMPWTFTYKTRIIDCPKEFPVDLTIGCWAVERTSDRKLALIKALNNSFFFTIWK